MTHLTKCLALAAICGVASLAPIRQASAQVAGEETIGVTVEELKLVVLGWSARRQLLGKEVRNDKKEKIGEIADVIVSPKQKTVSWAIIGVGGFLGLAERLVAIPMSQLTIQKDGFLLKGATKAAVKAMPEFRYAS
jgi:sporulation protein YlmC with PRC-barrel domain